MKNYLYQGTKHTLANFILWRVGIDISSLFFLVFRCYSLSDGEIQSYLECLSSCVKSGHSTAAVNEILRYDTLHGRC